MARSKSSLPQMRRHQGRNLARVRVDGKEIYFGKWGEPETQHAYEMWLAQYIACGRQLSLMEGDLAAIGKDGEPLGTIADLCAAYMRYCETYYQRNGQATSHIYAVKSALRSLIAFIGVDNLNMAPAEFTPHRFRRFIEWLATEFHGRRCRQTMNRYAGIIRSMYRWAAERDMVNSEIASRLSIVSGLRKGRAVLPGDPPPREAKGRVAASISAIERTRPQLEPCIRAMVDLQLFTGMRPGEVCAIRPRNIHPTEDKRVLLYVISRGVDKAQHHRDDLDPKDRRFALLGRRAAPLVRVWMRGIDPDDFVFSPFRAAQIRGRSSHRAPAVHYTTNAYRLAVRRACERARLSPEEHWTPHQLRHSFATQYADESNIQRARIQLGHRDITTTQGYLSPEWERLLPDAAERF